MTKAPEFSTVIYKILKYLDECQKNDVEPNAETAQSVVKVKDNYFRNAIEEMERKELIMRDVFYADNAVYMEHIKITLDGANYLHENNTMRKVSRFIDKAFLPELSLIIKAAAI